MDVRNLPQAQSGDKLRVHKVPLPSIFPSPGQEGRHKHPITPPLSRRQAYGFHRQALPSLLSQPCTQFCCAMAYYGAVWI